MSAVTSRNRLHTTLPHARDARLLRARELELSPSQLNARATLPYAAASFDAALCCVSVDYLTRPREVFHELHRVVRPGGTVHVAFSNRCFATKAVALWRRALDSDNMSALEEAVATFFRFGAPDEAGAAGSWREIAAIDIAGMGGAPIVPGNPMRVVRATRGRYEASAMRST